MLYLISAAAGLIGGIAAVLLFGGRRSRRKKERDRRKIEFSKLVLSAVLLTYFAGFVIGVRVVILDPSQLGVFLAYVGTPAATAIGFYSWKAKAENVVKIKQANPTATEGMPVDLNNIQP
ncbi:hypothetical protein [Clostridium sp. J1101437_171009_A5]|uniref:hypothetical protein n=1 Tax=Clostridium sp. J1101437_171009_A5 TaxID=2787098 RepID=UPI00189C4983|nr:hypothetical protein [Clostridium sp. J1101437_171009_A5]